MADNSVRARALSAVLFSSTASQAEKAEARAELTTLAQRGEHIAVAALKEAPVSSQPEPVTEVHTETGQPNSHLAKYLAEGVSPKLAQVLAEWDELSEANRVENIRLAPTRASRRAELEQKFTQHSVPADHQHGYRRRLEIYQQNYSFAEETKVFYALLADIEARYVKRV